LDDLGWKVYRLRHARIIRRPVGSPRNPNGSYSWNLLLEHVVFRAEEDVVAPDGDYMKMCVKHKVFTSTAELDQHLKAYAHYNLWDTVKLNELRHHVRSAYDTQQPLAAMQQAPEHTADDLLAGADAMQAVVDAETGVYTWLLYRAKKGEAIKFKGAKYAYDVACLPADSVYLWNTKFLKMYYQKGYWKKMFPPVDPANQTADVYKILTICNLGASALRRHGVVYSITEEG
jgi:hypothetical protein